MTAPFFLLGRESLEEKRASLTMFSPPTPSQQPIATWKKYFSGLEQQIWSRPEKATSSRERSSLQLYNVYSIYNLTLRIILAKFQCSRSKHTLWNLRMWIIMMPHICTRSYLPTRSIVTAFEPFIAKFFIPHFLSGCKNHQIHLNSYTTIKESSFNF